MYNVNFTIASLSRYNCIYVTSHVYSSIISSRTCWNCKRLLKDLDFFCECGKVQPVNTNWSYFEVLGYSNPQPIIDVADLSDRMRQSQKLLHPDKFSGKSPYEKKLALDASAFINKAYSCLQKPVERYEYILRLHGMSTDNLDLRKSGDLDFLSEVMDKREKVEEVVPRDFGLQVFEEVY
ncbi:Iron-sulfur cluster co-chaperone protein HscB [Schistosoma japonicum]|uniref:Iron-sulfur cluster co-chaperone protein HscB n=1 Tax=Schistosoma japonicum TaxID=6182 RepID=A0A4Z2CNW7_SCHJA|nr:Iron-sulfur cluster co-chaperone protein HscB [Schistosoma japonicum]